MNLPVVPYGVTNLSGLIEWLRTLATSIAVGWGQEHKPDGTHGVIHERGRTVAMGEWTSAPFNSADFTANGSMTWTVAASNVLENRSSLIGKTLLWSLGISGATVGGTPNTELRVAIPGGFTVASNTYTRCAVALDGGAQHDAVFAQAETGKTYIKLSIDLGATNWTAGTMAAFITIPVEIV